MAATDAWSLVKLEKVKVDQRLRWQATIRRMPMVKGRQRVVIRR